MRGRKPIPTALHELHGNPSKKAKPKAEPKPVGDLHDAAGAPGWFSESQRDGWSYAIKNSPPGLLKLIDRAMLVVFVTAEDIHRKAVQAQETAELLMETPNGLQMPSPYLSIINKQALIMARVAAEMGFSPSSRPRIYAGAPAPGPGLHGGTKPPQVSTKARRGRQPEAEPTSLTEYIDRDPDQTSIH